MMKKFAFGKNSLKCLSELDPRLKALAVPFPIPLNAAGDWDDKSSLWDQLAALERQCAEELRIEIINSIPWDRPHCELKD